MNRPLTPRATPPSDEFIHYGKCSVICLNPMVDPTALSEFIDADIFKLREIK